MTWWFEPLYGRFEIVTFALSGLLGGFMLGHTRGYLARLDEEKRRRDEASQFEVGDLITLSDGSTMRVIRTDPVSTSPLNK